jgi:signal transduction histidine kinase
MRWPWPAALVASVLTGALVVAGIALAAQAPTATTIAYAVFGAVVAPVWVGVGVVVARATRRNPVGALLALAGLGLAFTATREIGERVVVRHSDALARLDWLLALLSESSIWVLVALALLLLLFPDGRLPGPRWRPVPPLLVATALVHHGYGAVDPAPFAPPLQHMAHPFARPPFAVELVSFVADLTLLALLIACAAVPFLRYRRADANRRRRLKWLALAGVGVPGFIVACLLELLAFGAPGWVSLAVGLAAMLGVPAATAVAMLRHDLYDVDRALATSVAYALLSAALVAIFACTSFASGLLLGHDSTAAAAAATALAAVALSPLRRGLQRRVDARLYPLRRSALEAIAGLQRDVHAGAAPPEELEERLRRALRDPGLTVAYARPGADPPARGMPVVMGGLPIGALASPRLSEELLREVAAAAAPLVEVVRLRLDLAASRARLVQAGYAERRRLERDLHDGAQQRLVSLGMALRLAQRHLDDADVHGVIDQAVAELGTAVAELRQIAHGLRPSSLDDGLHAALAALTQNAPIPVGLDVCADRLPDDVATTAYYVASEAIANAVKHAGATRIDVHVVRRNGHLEVRVVDDGRGGADVGAGSGLAGLGDRVSAVGGALALETAAGSGTVVEARMPCGS